MKTLLLLGLASAALFAAETGGAPSTIADTASDAPKKSIVPGKYAGKYKNGGSDPVAEFIKGIAYDKGEIVPESFFALCRANGLDEDKIAGFETQVSEKTQGAAGRARMTLGNTLRAMARKNGSLKNLKGEDVAITGLEKPALSGAAAKAQETAATTETGPTDSASGLELDKGDEQVEGDGETAIVEDDGTTE